MIVGNELQLIDNAQLIITGLAQIKDKVEHSGLITGASLSVSGALFIENGDIDGFEFGVGNNINITAAPNEAAIEIWPSVGNPVRWSPVAGAFFKSIKR